MAEAFITRRGGAGGDVDVAAGYINRPTKTTNSYDTISVTGLGFKPCQIILACYYSTAGSTAVYNIANLSWKNGSYDYMYHLLSGNSRSKERTKITGTDPVVDGVFSVTLSNDGFTIQVTKTDYQFYDGPWYYIVYRNADTQTHIK